MKTIESVVGLGVGAFVLSALIGRQVTVRVGSLLLTGKPASTGGAWLGLFGLGLVMESVRAAAVVLACLALGWMRRGSALSATAGVVVILQVCDLAAGAVLGLPAPWSSSALLASRAVGLAAAVLLGWLVYRVAARRGAIEGEDGAGPVPLEGPETGAGGTDDPQPQAASTPLTGDWVERIAARIAEDLKEGRVEPKGGELGEGAAVAEESSTDKPAEDGEQAAEGRGDGAGPAESTETAEKDGETAEDAKDAQDTEEADVTGEADGRGGGDEDGPEGPGRH